METVTQPTPTEVQAGGPRTVGFMDIGTNSVRLLVARINPEHSYNVLTRQKEMVRLGEAEFPQQRLRPEAMQRTLLVCAKFAQMARSYGAEEIVTVATSASREAKNQAKFLQRLRREAGVDARLISGKEEARLVYLGVASGLRLGNRRALFIDVGGGSTEIAAGDQRQYHYLDTLKLGAIRLTSLFLPPEETGPVSMPSYNLVRRYVNNLAVRTLQRLRQEKIDLTIGSSGTVVNLAEIAARTFDKRALYKEEVLSYTRLRDVIDMLCALPLEERRRVPGINPERADIIIAGAAIVDTFMQELHIREILISERGLREGMLIDYLARIDHPSLFEEVSFRRRSVLHLGYLCNFDEAHARHVAGLVLELFDSAGKAGLHNFGDAERELLEYAALLHDIGGFLSFNDHSAHSAYLIRNADLLGFDQAEIIIMANLARHHRKPFPTRKNNPDFAAMDRRSRRVVRKLSVLLRIAESLDRGHARVVRHAKLGPEDKRSVLLEVTASQDCQLEMWGVENHQKAFKRAFKRTLHLEARVEPEA